jgi:ABC-type Fe3+/spermidine/putrescine transport system ATPase subunit
VPTEQRGLSMVFQSYAIWPHMTVFENVAYGLRVRGRSGAEIKERVGQALELVQMSAFSNRSASQLSGGQQQRVALARACAFSPSVLLFDEPLSNLDAKLRGDMRIELRELQHRLGVTSLYVTHDLEEALAMSDNIIVMRTGAIEQSGSPGEIYNYPRTEFVADFVGSANLIRGRVRRDLASGDAIAVETPAGQTVYGATHGRSPAADACLSVRAVHLSLAADRPPGDRNVWSVSIRRSVFLGDLTQVHVTWGDRELVVRQSGMQRWVEGQSAFLSVDPQHCVLLEAS